MNILSSYRIPIIALIGYAVLWLCLNPVKESQFGVNSDEGYYYTYANHVRKEGLPAFGKLITWYSSSEEALKHPTPMRAGYIILSSALFDIFGPSFHILGLCSTVSFLIFLYVCFYYIRKYFDLDTALLSVLLLSSSPLMLGLSRRALLDSPINLLWGTMVWLFLDFLMEPKRWKYICLIVMLAFSITVKEMSIILIPFFIIAGVWFNLQRKEISKLLFLGIIFWPVLLTTLFYWWILGSFSSLIIVVSDILRVHFSSQYSNPYAIEYSSGPWFRYMLDFLLANPIVTLLFVAYAGYLLMHRLALDFKRMYFLSYFVFIYAVSNILPHSKVVRFVLNLEMVMALFAVLMVVEMFKTGLRESQRWIVVIMLGIFTFNWISFMQLFYFPGLLDPISFHLLTLRHFIPSY